MKGQVIVLDREEKVVAVVTNEQVVEYDGYKVIVDHNEDCRYVPEEGRFKVIKPYPNKKTPQDVRDQGESERVKQLKVTISVDKKQFEIKKERVKNLMNEIQKEIDSLAEIIQIN